MFSTVVRLRIEVRGFSTVVHYSCNLISGFELVRKWFYLKKNNISVSELVFEQCAKLMELHVMYFAYAA